MLLSTLVTTAVGIQPWFNWTLPRAERVSSLINVMTTEEKIQQMITDTPEIPRLGIKSYHWRNNVQHGLVDNGVSTQFVQTIGMAATWSKKDIYNAGRVTSDEARAKHNIAVNESDGNSPMNYGLDLWGPVGNLMRDPIWGRGQETYGEDPFLATVLTEAYVDGLQNGPQKDIYETLATCKAFVAYGVDNEPPRLSFDPNITNTDLQQYYFPVWEACASNAASIMCAYNGVNGNPMCMSPMLQSVLRDDSRFNFTKPEQYIVTDTAAIAFMVTKFKRFTNRVDAAAATLNAGVDLNSGDWYLNLTQALEQKKITIDKIDTALTRLFNARIAAGMFDPPSRVQYSSLGQKDIASESHLETAKTVALRSQVLLRNTEMSASQLPWVKPLQKILVVGWGADDKFALLGNYYGCHFANGPVLNNCSIVTPLEGIQKSFPNSQVEYIHGVNVEDNNTSEFPEVLAAAETADAVIFVGGNRNCEGGQGKGGAHCEGEGRDRPDLKMPGQQTLLLQKLKPVAKKLLLVVMTGGPISMNWEADNIDAILLMWYGGTKGGEALGELITGKHSPTGRLPMTWPTGMSQVANELDMSLNTPGTAGRTYRYLKEMPLYKFGYGLTYSTFRYLNATAKPSAIPSGDVAASSSVCVSIMNSGTVELEEVIQIYALPPKFAEKTPQLMLVGFTRTESFLPGETLNVCIDIFGKAFRLMKNETSPFTSLPGKYKLYVGGMQPGAQGTHTSIYGRALEIDFTITD